MIAKAPNAPSMLAVIESETFSRERLTMGCFTLTCMAVFALFLTFYFFSGFENRLMFEYKKKIALTAVVDQAQEQSNSFSSLTPSLAMNPLVRSQRVASSTNVLWTSNELLWTNNEMREM